MAEAEEALPEEFVRAMRRQLHHGRWTPLDELMENRRAGLARRPEGGEEPTEAEIREFERRLREGGANIPLEATLKKLGSRPTKSPSP